jgi:hypothetical protein
MDCFFCLSIWVSIPFATVAGNTITEYIVYTMAMSGGAILIQKIFSNELL